MEEDKNLLQDTIPNDFGTADQPFDFIESEEGTALVCEEDTQLKSAVSAILKELGYHVTEVPSARVALKRMRFHIYDVVVLNESFDATSPDVNDVLKYLQGLSMVVRRQTFVVLLSSRYQTMDNMASFYQSVNLVINPSNQADIRKILERGIESQVSFYRVFYEAQRKAGKA
jgi:DNA-binding response OmpR family regulator